MSMIFDDNIKLSVPETAGRSIHICDSHPDEQTLEDEFVLCPEEPPQFLKLYHGGLQRFKTKPIGYCATDEFVQHPKETTKSIRIVHVLSRIIQSKSEALQKITSPITERIDYISKLYLKVKLSEMLFTLYFDHNFQYYNRPQRKPASKSFFTSLCNVLTKSDLFYKDLFSTAWFSSSLMLNVVLTSLFQVAASESQSLRYYHTGVLQQDGCPFKFEAVGFVNDKQIDKYDHDTKRDVPVASWMGNHGDKSYWDRETNYRQGWEKVFMDNLRILRHRLNDSSAFLTLQLMYGCERNTDGNVRGYYQYALNGKDFLYLDNKSLLWQSATYEAQISADRWNTDPIIAKSVKDYLTQHCTIALEKYISMGEQELNKRVRPEVKVWGRRQPDGVMRLQCLVYGFHPRAVDVKWVKDGVDQVPLDEMSPILPHPDGTYQIRAGVEVPETEGDTYACHVDHSSLEETLTVKWEPKDNKISKLAVVLSCLISVTIMISLIKLFHARSPKFYKPASSISSSA